MFAVATSYLVVGELSRLLAILPGYASPVWPAAGIALVAAVLGGRPAVLGVFVGSFLLNAHIGLAYGDASPWTPLGVAAAIGAGAAAQAWFGAWLVHRIFGPGNPLERGSSVPAFLVLAGPLACLPNPLWSIAWLRAAGYVAPAETLPHLLTWWVGDTLGVILVAPLALTWLAREEGGFGRWITLLIPLALCLTSVVFLFAEAQRRAEGELRLGFTTRAELLTGVLTREVDRIGAYTESIARAFASLPAIDRSAFRSLVRPWLDANVAIAAFEWLPLVPGEQRAAFEASARDEAFPDYRIVHQLPGGALAPVAERDYYAPILFVEPLEEERNAVGYDLASNPERRSAMEKARDVGELTATGRVRLVMFPDEWGVLLLAASYGGFAPPETVHERRAEVRGYAASVIRVDELAELARERSGAEDLVVRVTDVTEERGLLMTGPGPGQVAADALSWTAWHGVGGRRWRIDVLTAGPAPASWAGWVVLAVGLGWTALLVAYVLDARAQAVRVDRLVRERTAELARAVDELERSNLELRRFAYVASHDLREPLRTVATFSELVEADPRLDERARGYLGRVSAAARRMQGLVSELLSLARLEQRIEPFTDVCLNEAVHAAVDDLAAEIAQSGATVRVAPLPTALCDRVQMVQVFQHLLSNALKFRRPGVPPEIVVEGRTTPEGCEVIVRDNGIGVAPRDRERIFEIFQKLHPDDRYPGKGVGLATCRRIVERHKGRIWVESRLGEGSTFHVFLPGRGAA